MCFPLCFVSFNNIEGKVQKGMDAVGNPLNKIYERGVQTFSFDFCTERSFQNLLHWIKGVNKYVSL